MNPNDLGPASADFAGIMKYMIGAAAIIISVLAAVISYQFKVQMNHLESEKQYLREKIEELEDRLRESNSFINNQIIPILVNIKDTLSIYFNKDGSAKH